MTGTEAEARQQPVGPAAPTVAGAPTVPAFREDIQGLRAVAVLLVVVFHTGVALPGGYIGVDVFFVVSGFVIAGLLRRQVGATRRVPLRTFFARRARRLLPMLALTLAVTTVLSLFLLPPGAAAWVTARTAAAGAVFNANTFLSRLSDDYFALPPDANALLHVWSLSAEEQFYLSVPLLLAGAVALLRRRHRDPWRGSLVWGTAALAAGSYLLYAALQAGAFEDLLDRLGFTSPAAVAFYSAPARAWEFLTGALLAMSAHRAARLPARLRDAAGVVGLVAVVACAVTFDLSSSRSATWMLVPVVGTLLALLPGLTSGGPVAGGLSWGPLVWVGDRSYGWYLFHWPLIAFAVAGLAGTWAPVVAAGVALVLAAVAKRFVEDPVRHGAWWRGRRTAAMALACVVLPVVVAVGVRVADRMLVVDAAQAATVFHPPTDAGCNVRFEPSATLDTPGCTWEAAGDRGRVVLVGDSHAEMWSVPVTEAGNELGMDVTVNVMSGCPMVLGTTRSRDGEADVDCRDFVERTVDRLVGLRPSVVVLASGATGAVDRADTTWTDATGRSVTDPEDVAEVWRDGTAEVVRRLDRAGIPTLVVRDVPYQDQACNRLMALVDLDLCAGGLTASEAREQGRQGRAAETAALAGTAGARAVDPLPWLCTGGRCPQVRDGVVMYRDDDHLSVPGARTLTPRWQALLADHRT